MSEVHAQRTFHLPANYNINSICLLARDPHWLFAYWELSDEKKKEFIEEFGSELWERSIPVLKVTNVSKNTSFYIRINEFSNNWYINVADTNSLYVVEIGRKVSEHFFINLAGSNYVATPSDSISTNTNAYFIDYKNLRSGTIDPESGKIYETHDFKLYSQVLFGLSSPELFGINLQESLFGISSAELFGINIAEHLGISSGSFIK